MEQQELVTISTGMPVIEQQERAMVDIQISTAKAYPRNLKRVAENSVIICTMDHETAESCGYTLPRGGKSIYGPSVHLARILAQQYGNLRADAKCVEIGDAFVACEGVAFDLESNYAVKVQVRRKILDKYGKRYNEDMIGVTINAANAIAYRNAVLAVIPKSITDQAYRAAQQLITGDLSDETKLKSKRKKVLDGFKNTYDVSEKEVLMVIGKNSVDHIGQDELAQLIGLGRALKDGDTTVDDAFGRNKGGNNDPKKEAEQAAAFEDDAPAQDGKLL